MTKELAKKVYKHLIDHNMGFCFLENGELIDREYCLSIINS